MMTKKRRVIAVCTDGRSVKACVCLSKPQRNVAAYAFNTEAPALQAKVTEKLTILKNFA